MTIFIRRVYHLLLFMTLSAAGLSCTTDKRPPNIIYLLADDLGYAELGSYGQQWIQTPHLDRLASEGMRFTQHYSGNAVCAPSRCNLMTGKHPGHAYIRDNGDPAHLQHLKEQYGWEFPGQNPIPDEEVTIAEMLKQAGYATAAIGKWGLGHFGTTGDPNRQGFDFFYGFNCQRHAHNHYPEFLWRNGTKEIQPGNDRTLYGDTYSQDRFIEEGLSFIEANKDQPFFLYMPFAVPHLSIQVPDSSITPYLDVITEAPYEHTAYLEHPTPRAAYAAMVTRMDAGIGQIMERIKALGLDEDTIILFASDNGPTFNRLGGSDSDFFDSAGGFRGLKGSLYEGGIRVPLIARWPGKIQAGAVSTHLSAFWDMMPTFAEITNTEAPVGLDGISLAPTLLGNPERQSQHELLYWEFPGYGGQQAIRMGKWKAIRQNILRKDNPEPLYIQLFNLEEDREERFDVASYHPGLIDTLENLMASQRTISELFPMAPLDSLTRRLP